MRKVSTARWQGNENSYRQNSEDQVTTPGADTATRAPPRGRVAAAATARKAGEDPASLKHYNQEIERRGIIIENELKNLCREWQSRLRLNDWDIKIFIARERDMFNPGTQGGCKWELKNKMAIIKILDPIDYDPDIPWEQDMEKTLVHELLHLHFAPFDKYEADCMEGIAMEQAIDAIAKALVEIKRENTSARGTTLN